jgi:hypothetical protein
MTAAQSAGEEMKALAEATALARAVAADAMKIPRRGPGLVRQLTDQLAQLAEKLARVS